MELEINKKLKSSELNSKMTTFLNFIDWDLASTEEKVIALQRPKLKQNLDIKAEVFNIINQVRLNGDQALKDYALKFDDVSLQNLKINEDEIFGGYKQTSPDLIESLKIAIANLKKFHLAQKLDDISVTTMPGVVCEKRYLPIEKVGLYIPGGTAPLPSTLLMLAVPALIAGCEEIALITPPQKQKNLDKNILLSKKSNFYDSKNESQVSNVILAAAYLLNIKTIYLSGGAQAIAALAFGTETIPKVDKIFGPGNAYVTEAKMQVAYDPDGSAIDLPAGPSEVLVVADELADPEFVASDLLSQAEHDKGSQVILVTTSKNLFNQVELELSKQLETLPRKDIALKALESSRAIFASSLEKAMQISNQYAPEHLILHLKDLSFAKKLVRHAGSVFIGPWSPESVGDYASGTNHVLPTYGFARSFSGVGLDSFTKSISFQELSVEGLKNLGPHVERLAESEGLQAHKNAVSLRLKKIAEANTDLNLNPTFNSKINSNRDLKAGEL